MVTVIVGESCTFSLQFQGKLKMLKCVFCALLYMYTTINTDDRQMAAKERHFICKHISYHYDNNLLVA